MREANLKKRYLVVLADRKKARFFTIYLGNFEKSAEEVIFKDVPQKVKTEGYRPGKIQGHIRDHLLRHLKKVGKRAMEYVAVNKVNQLDGVFIGTHKELFSEVRDRLPFKLRHKVLGEFVTDTDESLQEVTARIVSRFDL